MNLKVDDFLNNVKKWQEELSLLRSIILDCGLDEDFKWKHPCYTFNNSNIVLIHGFKNYCAVLFHKGALLNDADKILIQQTENVQSGRQIRFTNTQEIIDLKATIKAYIFEALEVENAGLKVPAKKTEEFNVPEELTQKFNENPEFKKAFEALTPGRQRGYLLHFSGAKQAQTRVARIEKNIKRIFDGYGLNDCTCGLSKRKPNCDGSHKKIK